MKAGPTAKALIAISLAICTSSCAIPKPGKSIHAVARAKEHDRVSLTYRTESDRLNLAALPAALAAQPVAYQIPHTAGLPSVTLSTLTVLFPHPFGAPGALAKVTFRPGRRAIGIGFLEFPLG